MHHVVYLTRTLLFVEFVAVSAFKVGWSRLLCCFRIISANPSRILCCFAYQLWCFFSSDVCVSRVWAVPSSEGSWRLEDQGCARVSPDCRHSEAYCLHCQRAIVWIPHPTSLFRCLSVDYVVNSSFSSIHFGHWPPDNLIYHSGVYRNKYFTRQGKIAPLVHTMLAVGLIGYTLNFDHVGLYCLHFLQHWCRSMYLWQQYYRDFHLS